MDINKRDKLNEPISQKKTTAYASDLTDTLGHKLGKNQVEQYTQQKLFDTDIDGHYIYTIDNGKTIITTDLENDTPLKPIVSTTTQKVLDLLLTKLHDNFNGTNRVYLENITAEELNRKTMIRVSVPDYMDSVGITDKSTARANLKKASQELYNKSITHTFTYTEKYTDKKGKDKTRRSTITLNFRLLDATATFKNGNVIFYLSQRATPYLTEYSITYNRGLLKTDIQAFPHSYSIGTYLTRQYDRTKKGHNNGKVSVIKILENCDIPNIEEVENRKYKAKIKTPLLDSLDHLQEKGVISEYHFYDKHGNTYTRYESFELPIQDFINLMLDYSITE